MQQPVFTVVTVSYNSEQWIRHTIESVLASSFGGFEYLIADDASSDRTWSIIEEYNDPRIKKWRNVNNIGEYNNRNAALSKAEGEFILFVDGDDILYRETLKEYSGYIKDFPDTFGIWGVHANFFDFIVFPYQFTPHQLSCFNFLSLLPIAQIGLAETIFRTSGLKKIGGFDTSYSTSDTHAKKKFSCYFPVTLVPSGRSFWRVSPNQASKQVLKKMKNMVENFRMDKEILYHVDCPLSTKELKQARVNFKNRQFKLLLSTTLLRGDLYNFFRILSLSGIPLTDIAYIFRKTDYSYKASGDGAHPLMNEYHFKNQRETRSLI